MYLWLALPLFVILYLWFGYGIGALLLGYAQKCAEDGKEALLYKALFPLGFPSSLWNAFYCDNIRVYSSLTNIKPVTYCGCVAVFWPIKLFYCIMASVVFSTLWIIMNIGKILFYLPAKAFHHLSKDKD